jgi:hypothetical protein
VNREDKWTWRTCGNLLDPTPGSSKNLNLLPARTAAAAHSETADSVRNQCVMFSLVESDAFIVRNHYPAPVSDRCQPDVIVNIMFKVIGMTFDVQTEQLERLGYILAASPVKEDRRHAAAGTVTSSNLSASFT